MVPNSRRFARADWSSAMRKIQNQVSGNPAYVLLIAVDAPRLSSPFAATLGKVGGLKALPDFSQTEPLARRFGLITHCRRCNLGIWIV
jgi:hypothetical protein